MSYVLLIVWREFIQNMFSDFGIWYKALHSLHKTVLLLKLRIYMYPLIMSYAMYSAQFLATLQNFNPYLN